MDELTKIKQAVFQKRPALKEIHDKFGHLNLKNYVKDVWEIPNQKPDKEFVNTVSQFLNTLYGSNIASQAEGQLLAKPLVSTIDHLGIWGHPIFLNADLIYSLYFKSSEYAICLATESVSLNNVTSWSGSVLKHGYDGNLHRYSFFPDRLKTLPVFTTPAITENNLARFSKSYGQGAENALEALRIDTSKNDFTYQACLGSFNLWQKVFPSAPKLIYLPLESIVLDYLKNILKDEENVISKIILSSKGKKLWQKYFSNEHTFMFWGIDEKGRRVSLKSLAGDSDELIKIIESRKIYPSSPLCFMVLLYAGFACVGGFTQTTWLTGVKKKFVNLLEDFKISQSVISNIANVPTKNFAESSLASLKIGEMEVQPTAIDLLQAGKDYYLKYQKLSEQITLSESLDSALPEIYNVVVPPAER
jgi:hypothetical protein